MLRGRRTLIVLLILAIVIAGGALTVRWLLRPENLARVITQWVERELGAALTLSDTPGVRLIPRLQLTLHGARLERSDALLASADELSVALPWSTLWLGELAMESLSIRRPVIAWPELTALLSELSDTDAPSRAPMLPQIAVGMRVEDGTLLSGETADAWRADRISLVTTPLRNGEMFHLDAGARIVNQQPRIVSLSFAARPSSPDDRLRLDDVAVRLVVGPEGLPLAEGMTIDLAGSLQLDDNGLTAIDLAGHVPGWPEWLPNVLGFLPDQDIELTIRLPEAGEHLALALVQGDHTLGARLRTDDLNAALSHADRPLVALAALRGQWQLDALTAGGVRIEGIELDIEAYPSAAPAESPTADDAEENADADPDR